MSELQTQHATLYGEYYTHTRILGLGLRLVRVWEMDRILLSLVSYLYIQTSDRSRVMHIMKSFITLKWDIPEPSIKAPIIRCSRDGVKFIFPPVSTLKLNIAELRLLPHFCDVPKIHRAASIAVMLLVLAFPLKQYIHHQLSQ